MINWNQFELDVLQGLLTGHETMESFAQNISNSYLSALLTGTEIVGGNSITAMNISELTQGILDMLEKSLEDNVVNDSGLIEEGLKQSWLTAEFTKTGIPPGFSTVVSVEVTEGGIIAAPLVPPPPSRDASAYVVALSNMFRSHTPTVQGLITGTSTSTPPAPISVPFQGYF